MSEKMRVAVPIEAGEGLEAVRSAHFGHAPAFVLVDIEGGVPVAVSLVVNPPHAAGGCGATVGLLAGSGVDAVSAAGMGRGPLSGLAAAGIAVHHDTDSSTVGEAVAAIVGGRTAPFDPGRACSGHRH